MRTLVLAIFTVLAAAVPSYADLLLDLQYTDGSVAKTVNSGDSVMVNLILRDPSNDTFLSAEGLFSGGGAFVQTLGSAVITPTAPAATSGPGFGAAVSPVPAAPPRPGLITSVFLPPAFPIPIPVGIGTTDILLATMSFVATGAAGLNTITADVIDPSGTFIGNQTFTSNTDLDMLLTNLATTPGNFGSVSLTVSAAAVPEPSTLLVGCLIVGGGLFWKRRKSMAACDS